MNDPTNIPGATVAIGPPQPHDIFTDNTRFLDLDAWNRAALDLHHMGGIHQIEREGYPPFWAVIDFEGVRDVERQPQLFTNAPHQRLGTNKQLARKSATPLRTLVHMDGKEHKQYRGLTDDWFKSTHLRQLNERFTELSLEALAKLEAFGGECDFATDIAMPYPLQVILKIMGLPEKDYPRMLALTQEFFGEGDPDLERKEKPEERRKALIKDFMDYFIALRRERQEKPADDLASSIANGEIDGETIADLEAVSYYVLVATAGHDTTSAAIAGGLQALIERPDQLRKLQNNMELLNNAVEEMLRWTAPVRHFMRTAQADTEILGQKIKKGDWLYLSFRAANFDPKVFENPLQFDIERKNAKQNISFGFGVHHCLGATLARSEMRNLFGHLVPRIESIELGEQAEMTKTIFVGGYKKMPIRYKLKSNLEAVNHV